VPGLLLVVNKAEARLDVRTGAALAMITLCCAGLEVL
jgi:hypothetical protein